MIATATDEPSLLTTEKLNESSKRSTGGGGGGNDTSRGRRQVLLNWASCKNKARPRQTGVNRTRAPLAARQDVDAAWIFQDEATELQGKC